jgi:hypothetical protein
MKSELTVRSIRRLTADKNHNAFTGAAWFQGALYVAFRQGDAHVCNHGRLVVLRSRDEGARFDTVAVIRGKFDTRDAHLYTDGDRRLFVAGFEADPAGCRSGMAWTDDGLHWSAWTRYTGADGYAMWRPRCHDGRFYCAGYGYREPASEVAWFESRDGRRWEKQRIIHAGADQPSECSFDFRADGSIIMLMRREHASRKPLLLRSAPPYRVWRKVELDVPLHGPVLWLVGDDIWISGRWYLTPSLTHQGVFKVVKDKPVLQLVLPSGPGGDMSYMGVARHPLNARRFALSYYSGHTAGDDPQVCQWDHPDIYLADVTFAAEYLREWRVSDVLAGAALRTAKIDQAAGWRTVTACGEKSPSCGFADATSLIAKRAGVVFFRKDIEVGPTDAAMLHLGFDGPVLARLNGEAVYEGFGTNPALPDQASVLVRFRHGVNRLEIALDTNGGRACGIFARWEPAAAPGAQSRRAPKAALRKRLTGSQ